MIGFDGNEFHGEIAPALLDLVQEGIVRLLDGVYVYKDADGTDSGSAFWMLRP